MSALSRRPDEQALAHLAAGRRIVEAEWRPVTGHAVVWSLVIEAVTAIETTIGDQEKRWLSSGTRSGGWTMIGLTTKEAREIEQARLMTGIKPGDGMKGGQVQGVDYGRALDVLDWLRFCRPDPASRAPSDADRLLERAAYELAAGRVDRARALFVRSRGRGVSAMEPRKVDSEIRTRTTAAIRKGLEAQCGIALAADGTVTRTTTRSHNHV